MMCARRLRPLFLLLLLSLGIPEGIALLEGPSGERRAFWPVGLKLSAPGVATASDGAERIGGSPGTPVPVPTGSGVASGPSGEGKTATPEVIPAGVGKPVAPPGPHVDWQFLGPGFQPVVPRVVTMTGTRTGRLVTSFERRSGETTHQSLVFDGESGALVERLSDNQPLALEDSRGNLGGLSVDVGRVRLMIRQVNAAGEFAGVRLLKMPNPPGASAAIPYLTTPARFAPDGALILVGSGRDRFYRINMALGESRLILPSVPVDIVDFDLSPTGELVVLDAFDQQVVWMDLTGEVAASLPLGRNEGPEPRVYHLSLAAGPERAVWLGVITRQPDGSFVPELQRLEGKMRARQRLERDGRVGVPVRLAADGSGGVFVADEAASIYRINPSMQVIKAWKAEPTNGVAAASGASIFLSDSGTELEGLGTVMENAQAGLEACYGRLLKVQGRSAGSYRLLLSTVDRSIQKVDVYEKDFEDFGLESCVSQALRESRFPGRVGRQTFRVLLKFVPPSQP